MTTEEFNIHYNNLRLTDQRMSDDLGVNYTTVWRWRTGRAAITTMAEHTLRIYFDEVREELEAENFTYSDGVGG